MSCNTWTEKELKHAEMATLTAVSWGSDKIEYEHVIFGTTFSKKN
jgi:hypothetical protein